MLEQHFGNCMDLTLLYTACLEAMDLNPFMVVVEGHIFAGVWLVDGAFADILVDDPSQLEKRMAFRSLRSWNVRRCVPGRM